MREKISTERQQIIRALEAGGHPLAPHEVAEIVDKPRSSTKKLMYSMLSDGQLTSANDGRYVLPVNEAVTDDPPVTEAVTASCRAVTATEGKGDFPATFAGIGAYSEQDGGSIPYSELRRREGYDD